MNSSLPSVLESLATDASAPQLLLIRSGREQKTFVANALQLVEELTAPCCSDPGSFTDSVARIETQAAEFGLEEVSAAMQSVGQMLLACSARVYQHPHVAWTEAALPETASRPLAALLLRVYLTGSDAGGHVDRQRLQQTIARHMHSVLPSAGYLHCNGN